MNKDSGMELHQQIVKLKEEIERKKANRQELLGQLKSVEAQLEDHGVKSLDEAQAKIEEEQAQLSAMNEKIQTEIEALSKLLAGGE